MLKNPGLDYVEPVWLLCGVVWLVLRGALRLLCGACVAGAV
jgi:hypothetical protein